MKKPSRKDTLRHRWPKGCAAPVGYFDWHEWAEAQHLHGLRQSNCIVCGRYVYPQQQNKLGACADVEDCAQSVMRFGKLKLKKIV